MILVLRGSVIVATFIAIALMGDPQTGILRDPINPSHRDAITLY